MNSVLRFLGKYRRLYGFIMLILLFIFADPVCLSLIIGIPVIMLGLFIRIWASGFIYKDDSLATTGPYSVIRNPLYFGSFVLGLGCTIAANIPVLLILYIITFPLVYYGLIITEEEGLTDIFGEEYITYCEEVPRLIPFLWQYKRPYADWSLKLTFIEHKEYVNTIAAAVVIIYLIVRCCI